MRRRAGSFAVIGMTRRDQSQAVMVRLHSKRVTQSIELLLDDSLDAAVRAQWEALRQAQLPSMAMHMGETNRPHITMAVADMIPPSIEEALNALVSHVPMPIRLGPLALFGPRRGRLILVRLVTPSQKLLTAQMEAAELVNGLAGTGSYFVRGGWTPHVTLARNLLGDKIAMAIEVLGPMREISGAAVSMRRWDGQAGRAWPLPATSGQHNP